MGAKKRAPRITVPSDDFVIEEDGEEYHPHAGEQVTFRKRVSARDLLVIAKAQELQEELQETGGAAELASFFYNDACPVLARAILAWDWTDPYEEDGEGNPVPYSSPTVDTLRDLDAMTELQYLLEKWLDVTSSPDEESGEDQS